MALIRVLHSISIFLYLALQVSFSIATISRIDPKFTNGTLQSSNKKVFVFFIAALIATVTAKAQFNFAFWQQRPEALSCPTGYVIVPKNTDYVSADFCVMKYEAKAETNAGGSFDADGLSVVLGDYKPASVASDQPWRDITQGDAKAECQSLGAGYDLISNAQWQTVARNLELEGANWTTGTVGSGCMFQGNNGETACGFDGANPDTSASNARGIFTLSNAETVYDVAGNVQEWLRDDNSTNYGSDDYFAAITTGTHTTTGTLADGIARSAKAQFGPSGSYGTSNNNSGLGRGYLNSNAGAVVRGSVYSGGVNSGVFHVALSRDTTTPYSGIGFRCIYAP